MYKETFFRMLYLVLIIFVTISSGAMEQPKLSSNSRQFGLVKPPKYTRPQQLTWPPYDGWNPRPRSAHAPIRRFKRQLGVSFPFYQNRPHTFSGQVFSNQQSPNLNLGIGLGYAHQKGHGASLTASQNFKPYDRFKRDPGTNVGLNGNYRLKQWRNGYSTLDAHAGVSKTFYKNPPPYNPTQYNFGLTYTHRFG
jgi:Attacin, C-terminal region